MTVAELIDRLKEFPQDKIIAINYDIHEVDIELLECFYDRDYVDSNYNVLENKVVNLS